MFVELWLIYEDQGVMVAGGIVFPETIMAATYLSQIRELFCRLEEINSDSPSINGRGVWRLVLRLVGRVVWHMRKM